MWWPEAKVIALLWVSSHYTFSCNQCKLKINGYIKSNKTKAIPVCKAGKP